MEEVKKPFYIDIKNVQIYPEPDEADWQFKIFATDKEIAQLRECIQKTYEADLKTFSRAHIPFLEYHKDSQNEEYDTAMKAIYAMIYKLGDAKTRNHIENMGILNTDRI